MMCSCDVPQWSVLGAILFTTYILSIADILASFGINQQQYTDGTQLRRTIHHHLETVVKKIGDCIVAIQLWFAHNGLALNQYKSKAILLSMASHAKSLLPLNDISAASATVHLKGSGSF